MATQQELVQKVADAKTQLGTITAQVQGIINNANADTASPALESAIGEIVADVQSLAAIVSGIASQQPPAPVDNSGDTTTDLPVVDPSV